MGWTPLVGWLSAALFATLPAFAADEPHEQVTTQALPPATAQRIYLGDFGIGHVMDGRLNVIDGASLKLLGMVATGFAGLPALAPDRSELYVATTYYERHDVRTGSVYLVERSHACAPDDHAHQGARSG